MESRWGTHHISGADHQAAAERSQDRRTAPSPQDPWSVLNACPTLCPPVPPRLQALRRPGPRRALAALVPAGDVADNGKLLVSEAVANAVEHTGSDQVRVLFDHDDASGELVCAVRDSSTHTPVATGAADTDSENGRGLHLIDTLADAWGYLPDSHGKWIWFSLTAAA